MKQAGTYFFTVYQDNGRKYKNASGVYQKSPSWIFLAKAEQTNAEGEIIKINALACNASAYQHSTIEMRLEPGEYLIISKVSWNYWDEHPYVLSSYGPAKVAFGMAQPAPIQLLNDFIGSWSIHIINSKKIQLTNYKETAIWKCFYFEHTEGVGFIAVGNNEEDKKEPKMIETTLTLEPCKGIEVLAPYLNPVVIKAKAGQISTCCFIVEPQGYSYKLMEGYKLFIVKPT